MWSNAAAEAARLSLRIRNVASLENGVPIMLELDQRGAVIGRSAMVDWSLPDPNYFISGRHCEIEYRGGEYRLVDISTNGTFLNGSPERMGGPHTLRNGDIITIGPYEVTVALSGGAAAAAAEPPPPAQPAWRGWDSQGQAPETAPSDWDKPKPMSAISGQGSMSANWSPPPADTSRPPSNGWGPPGAGAPSQQPPASPGGTWGPPPSQAAPPAGVGPGPAAPSAWDQPEQAPSQASGWSSAAPDRPPPPSADDIWGRIAEGNVVDWARGGFGRSEPAPLADPLGLAPPAAQALPQAAPLPQVTATPYASASPAPAGAGGGRGLARFLAEAGLSPGDLRSGEDDALAAAGGLLRRLVAGLVVMLEARARAKKQMGAQTTSLEFNGNNPMKFARTPEQALAQLLNPPERGFLDAGASVEDALQDLQSHQLATLKAMQGALRATLDRFSPTAIRQRAEAKGLLQRIMPGAGDAALWQAYEREFGGVARGSDEAFMDVFAKEFRRAYDEESAKRLRR